MNIQEISAMQSPVKMREEVAKMAIKRNCSADDVWDMIEGFRKTQKEGQRARIPTSLKDILPNIISNIKITESPIEDILRCELLARHIKFETQENIDKYRVDFFFRKANLIVEADGRKYHSTQRQRDNDFKRQLALIKKGYTVLRFTGSEIYQNVMGCVDKIEQMLNEGDTKKETRIAINV